MRLGVGRGGTPPHKVAGFALMAVGGLVLLLAMPLYVWAAAIGGAVTFLGFSVNRYR